MYPLLLSNSARSIYSVSSGLPLFYLIIQAFYLIFAPFQQQQIVLFIHIGLFFHFISFYIETRDNDATKTLCFALVCQFYSQFVILLSACLHTGEDHLLYRSGTNFPLSVSILIILSQFTYYPETQILSFLETNNKGRR